MAKAVLERTFTFRGKLPVSTAEYMKSTGDGRHVYADVKTGLWYVVQKRPDGSWVCGVYSGGCDCG